MSATPKASDTLDDVHRRIAAATEPRPTLVACALCLEDYEVTYVNGERISKHVCPRRKAL